MLPSTILMQADSESGVGGVADKQSTCARYPDRGSLNFSGRV